MTAPIWIFLGGFVAGFMFRVIVVGQKEDKS